jgi:hypothetical protein
MLKKKEEEKLDLYVGLLPFYVVITKKGLNESNLLLLLVTWTSRLLQKPLRSDNPGFALSGYRPN